MMPRFTVIQGGRAGGAPRGRATAPTQAAPPEPARLAAVGAALRLRLSALPRTAPEARAATPDPRRPAPAPIPPQAFLGVRPAGWEPAPATAAPCRVGTAA